MSARSLTTIIGHSAAVSVLERGLEQGNLAHAYIFVGPEGVGKTTIAHRVLAAWLGVEVSALSTHPDIVWLEREVDEDGLQKAEIGVDATRAFIERVTMSPIAGARKAAYVEEADCLTTASANALLKTIEEPKGDMVCILRAPSVESIPKTIISRCQIIRFAPVAHGDIEDALRKRGVSHEDAQQLAAQSLGRPGYAIRALTDSAFQAAYQLAMHQLQRWSTEPLYERLRSVTDMMPKETREKRLLVEQTLDGLERAVREGWIKTSEQDPVSVRHWAQVIERIRHARSALHHNVSPQSCLEHVLLAL